MNARKRRRLAFVLALLAGGTGAAALSIAALQDNVLYFYGPSEVYAKHVTPGVAFRIGGIVESGSLHKGPGALVRFRVGDGRTAVPVRYEGLPPALFREGQGVVAIGKLNGAGTFEADQVLAKHDEKYMPPEVADALKRFPISGTRLSDQKREKTERFPISGTRLSDQKREKTERFPISGTRLSDQKRDTTKHEGRWQETSRQR
jgi:cytochrome c-type biogenesis protein CcmE